MSVKEIDRLEIIKQLLHREINGPMAARTLALSTRQIRRLKFAVKKNGARGLIHGNRGQPSPNRLPDQERKKIAAIVSEKYLDFSPTFAAEKLSELHGITHDPKTIQTVLIEADVWTKRTKLKKEQHRSWRERRPAYGDLVQFDGSYEHWFEDRNGTDEACLLAAIDDATGNIIPRAVWLRRGG